MPEHRLRHHARIRLHLVDGPARDELIRDQLHPAIEANGVKVFRPQALQKPHGVLFRHSAVADQLAGILPAHLQPPGGMAEKAEQQRRVLAHAFDLPQLFHGRFQHGMQGSEPVQQTMRQGIYVALGNGVKQHQLQHLVVCEALQPSGEEPFPHPLPVPGMLSSHTAPSSARLWHSIA